MCNKYEGFSNRFSWFIANYIDNNEWEYHATMEMAHENLESAPKMEEVQSGIWSVEIAPIFALEDQLRKYFEDKAEEDVAAPYMFIGLLDAALGEVNWKEVAEHFITKARQG